MRVIMLGAPGAGKGTQAKLIVEKCEYLHISTGDLLRGEIARNTELGKQAAEIINRGDLVPDAIVEGMIKNKIVENPQAKGFLFDGFPRTINQGEVLDKMLAEEGSKIDGVLEIHVDDEVIINRLSGRFYSRILKFRY